MGGGHKKCKQEGGKTVDFHRGNEGKGAQIAKEKGLVCFSSILFDMISLTFVIEIQTERESLDGLRSPDLLLAQSNRDLEPI